MADQPKYKEYDADPNAEPAGGTSTVCRGSNAHEISPRVFASGARELEERQSLFI
jgi:hypothetical protein